MGKPSGNSCVQTLFFLMLNILRGEMLQVQRCVWRADLTVMCTYMHAAGFCHFIHFSIAMNAAPTCVLHNFRFMFCLDVLLLYHVGLSPVKHLCGRNTAR